jgi:hypothetical protein
MAGALALVACGPDFDPASRVVDLRVLAVRADRPFAHPGETVHLDALAIEPRGRALTWGWATCQNPEDVSVAGCLAAVTPTSPKAIGEGMSTFAFDVAPDVIGSLSPELRRYALVGVVAVACPGTLAIEVTEATGGLPFRCTGEGGRVLGHSEIEVGLKRIVVRDSDRNANPAIARVLWNGEEWAESDVKEAPVCNTGGNKYSDCSDGPKIQIELADGSVESGSDEFGAPFAEQVVVQFYATAGIFEQGTRTAAKPETHWVARSGDEGQTVTHWFVARDDRGGVTWTTRQAKVR